MKTQQNQYVNPPSPIGVMSPTSNEQYVTKEYLDRKFEEFTSRLIPIFPPVPPAPYSYGPPAPPYQNFPMPPIPPAPLFQMQGGVDYNSQNSYSSMPPQTPPPFFSQEVTVPTAVPEVIHPQSINNLPPENDTLNLSEEKDTKFPFIAVMGKFLKTQNRQQIYTVLLLQYFVFGCCNISPQSNWTSKEEFTALELFAVVTANPGILGDDLDSLVSSVWTGHLSKNVYSYFHSLINIIEKSDRVEVKQLITLLSRKPSGFSKEILLGPRNNRLSFKSPGSKMDLKDESRIKAKIRFKVLNFLNTTALILIETGFRCSSSLGEDLIDNTLDSILANYQIKCSSIIKLMEGILSMRGELAQKKTEAKKAKKEAEKTSKTDNVAEGGDKSVVKVADVGQAEAFGE